MARAGGGLLFLILLGGALCAQQRKAPPVQEPPEEDETLTAKEYSFNPLQAENELKVGNFYYRKGKYKAAAGRFQEAAKWNPGYAEAYVRLGEAREKLKDRKGAREAYGKFLKLAPDHPRAAEIKRRLARLG